MSEFQRVTVRLVLMLLSMGCISSPLRASISLDHVHPPHWWSGFTSDTFQVMFHGRDIGKCEVKVAEKGLEIVKVIPVKNTNYLFVNVRIQLDLAHVYHFDFFEGRRKRASCTYEIKERREASNLRGLKPSDLMYLLMPDRFANGDKGNDVVPSYRETQLDRKGDYERHGGDLEGVIQHLDYIQQLGVNALWLNPVFENNRQQHSYHGYAITDHYAIDKRLGSLSDYRRLVDLCHQRKIKMVKDVIYNHCDIHHFLFEDQPDSTWFHHWPEYTTSNFKAAALFDPYASEYDKKKFNEGWFDREMPDFDQENPLLSAYLIQNTIWWVEEFGLDALRIDTYTYPDQAFMKELNRSLLAEYPSLSIFGETWVHQSTTQSYFVGDSRTRGGDDNYLPAVTDFQLAFALQHTVNQNFGWKEGVSSLYYVMAKDVLYPHPEKHVTFFDNHDLERLHGLTGGDLTKLHMSIALLMTQRGTPCLLYGTELLMAGTENHGKIREDMPGGWSTDPINKFQPQNWSDDERATIELIKNLQAFRQEQQALFNLGRTTQFVPEEGVYAYFRSYEGKRVFIIVNASDDRHSVDVARFEELLKGERTAYDVVHKKEFELSDKQNLAPWQAMVLYFD